MKRISDLYDISWKSINPTIQLYFSRAVYVSLGVGFLLLYIFYLQILNGKYGPLPQKEELSDIQTNLATEVYSRNEQLIGKYFSENRTKTELSEISPWVLQALVATEDARYYEHNGVDHKSLARVAVKSILMQDRSSGGGSTISQQLAKNLYPRESHGWLTLPAAKFREIIIAKRLERIYSKEELLTLYLNTVPFGEGTYGIKTAARRYFNQSPSKLSIENAAVLIGMLKATTTYNPHLNPEASLNRRNTVLSLMAKNGAITSHEADSISECEIKLSYNPITMHSGHAPHYTDHVKKLAKELLENQPCSDGAQYHLDSDGLKIYTTLDENMQAHAEAALYEHMKQLQHDFDRHYRQNVPPHIWKNAVQQLPQFQKLKSLGKSEHEIDSLLEQKKSMQIFTYLGTRDTLMSTYDSLRYNLCLLHAGILVIDPENGEVKAWVGGIDHRYFQYDHVTSQRQVGSTFKPIVYSAALKENYEPCDYIPNSQETYGNFDDWTPRNANGKYDGEYSLQGGLVNSVNTVTVKLMQRIGTKNVNRLARRMGIKGHIPNDPTASLGSGSASLMELVQVYATMTHDGYRRPIRCIQRIEDKYGQIIWEAPEKTSKKRILSSDESKTITHLLQNVVNQGTATRLRYRYELRQDIAGKTGTTQNHADGWFIGALPGLVAGVWVGADNPGIHFKSMRLGQAANTALPIWAKFIQRINKDPQFAHFKKKRFPRLDDDKLAELSCPNFRPDLKPLKIIPFELKPQIALVGELSSSLR